MINLQKTVDIKEELNMRMRVSVDDEVIIERPSDSLLLNFLRILYANAGGGNPTSWYNDSNDERPDVNDRRTAFTLQERNDYGRESGNTAAILDETQVPAIINLDNNNNGQSINIRSSTNGLVHIWSREADVSGYYCASRDSGNFDPNGSPNVIYLWEVDNINNVDSTVTVGNPVDLTGTDVSSFDGDLVISSFQKDRRNADASYGHFRSRQIILGASPVNETVKVEDQWMPGDVTPKLGEGGTSLSPPAVSTNESKLEFSETFTNNLPYALSINSVGIRADYEEDPTLIARDPASFNIPSDSTITITYFFTISNSGSGGLMAQFNELFYRQLNQTDRELVDILNNNRNRDESSWNFRMAWGGGDNTLGEYGRGVKGRAIGPRVGTSTNSVSNTDFDVLDPIPHGPEDGRLFYGGSIVEDLNIDLANGKAYFDVSRMFENRGSVGVDIDEVGVTCASSGQSDNTPEAAHLISRHVLGTTETVPSGEILKLTYRFEVNV